MSAKRIARNDATFREANERIHGVAEELSGGDETVPFICECADPGCREVVVLTLEQYSEVREQPRFFLNVPGHQVAAQGWAQVRAERDGYVIVEKVGDAGEIAESLDPGGSD